MVLDTLEVAQKQGRAPWTNPVHSTHEFEVYQDIYPVTPGHTLVVPRVNDLAHLMLCFRYAIETGQDSVNADNDITGYNVGINQGESAGQTCMYPHVHLIFRRNGDMLDPRGGVRHVIPEKGNYMKTTDEIVVDNEGVGC